MEKHLKGTRYMKANSFRKPFKTVTKNNKFTLDGQFSNPSYNTIGDFYQGNLL